MIKNIFLLLSVFFLIWLFLFGLDLEAARTEYNQKGYSTNCIFKTNCARYNNK